MSPHWEGETGTHHTESTVERGGGKWMLEDKLSCKRMLTVNAITLKVANTSQSRSTWSPGACTYKTLLTTMRTQALFVVNSVKLEFKCILFQVKHFSQATM